ncbi:MAG TPA: YncE family protein [Gemmatimonadales bacterium]|jgi:YVTN family beta-propeller protein|nr:YncE family protein [Gemmatimonadales bacterium]
MTARYRGAAIAALLFPALALAAACASGGPQPGDAAPAHTALSGARLYVPNQSDATVSVVEPATGRVLATVDLRAAGFTADAKPHSVVAEPDGSAWYVSLIGDNAVAKFDRENRLAGKVQMETPGMLAIDPVRDRVYASRSMGAVNAPASIGVIRRSDMTLLDELDVILPRPHAIAADTVTGRVYVAGLGDNRIATITPDEHVTLTTLEGPLNAYVTFALSPDGRTMAASTQLTARLLGLDVSTGTPTLLGSASVLPFGYQIAYAPDGRSVWLGDQRSGAVTAVSTSDWTVSAVIRDSAFSEPHGVVISPDSRTIYVSSHGPQTAAVPTTPVDTMHHGMHAGMNAPRAGGTLAFVDARTDKVTRVIPVGRYAAGMGLGGTR